MIQSEILNEKHRVQTKLSEESKSICEYLLRSHVEAEKIATSYGVSLKYAEMPNNRSNLTSFVASS